VLFETVDNCRKMRVLVVPTNEENFDKLASHLEGMLGG
jgi:hypothetical protein